MNAENLRLDYVTERPRRKIRVPDGVRLRAVGTVRVGRKNVKVFVVSGETIRLKLDVDYTMGGNGARYAYVPLEEIWLDENLSPTDATATLFHEAVELKLMKKGMDYEKAHDSATELEQSLRRFLEKHPPSALSIRQASSFL